MSDVSKKVNPDLPSLNFPVRVQPRDLLTEYSRCVFCVLPSDSSVTLCEDRAVYREDLVNEYVGCKNAKGKKL